MLGVSYGEVFMLIAIGAVLLGPKDLPVLARGAGHVAGRAAAWASLARNRFAQFSKDSEVSQLHEELTTSLRELRSLRSELRSGVNILDPGPMTQRLMNKHGLSRPTLPPAEGGSPPTAIGQATASPKVQASVAGPEAAGSSSTPAGRDIASGLHAEQHPGMSVSAAELGLIKRSPGHVPTASSIMQDAVTESDVAHAVQKFMESQKGRRD